jgi:hypothetical protein
MRKDHEKMIKQKEPAPSASFVSQVESHRLVSSHESCENSEKRVSKVVKGDLKESLRKRIRT